MSGKKYEEKLFLDIPFGEALERFSETKLSQVAASIAKSKKANPPGEKLSNPPGNTDVKNVVRLATRRKPK